VLRGVEHAGFTDPRPIQIGTIPAVMQGRDVLGLAQTGTGKTAAFALPILTKLLARGGKSAGPRALILAPTRELASQIEREINTLGRYTPVRTTTVFGGVPIPKQVRNLRQRPDVIVACPGRLLDLHQRGAVNLRGIEMLVLDEGDHMFDMGFLPDIRRILAALPARRQNLLFSATMPKEIRRLTDEILHKAHVVELESTAPVATVEHALYPVSDAKKQDLLEHLLEEHDFTSAIVFLRTKHRAKRLAEKLGKRGHSAVALQGNMSQGQRDRAMKGFREGRFDVLVATDIAARGIDVAGISHVVNFDIPNTTDAYTHRIGRTGRAEKRGKACTFVTASDRAQVRAIEAAIGSTIRKVHLPAFGGDTRAEPPASGKRDRRAGSPARRRNGAKKPVSRGRRSSAGAANRRSRGFRARAAS
jgi:superfamily II DNA/RNA helicase